MGPVARQQLVATLLALRSRALGQQLGGEEPLGQVVDAAVAVAPGEAQDPGLGQRLEDRPDLVGRAPVPVDRRARLDVGRRQRAVAPDPLEQLLDERRVLVEAAPACSTRLRSQATRYHGSSAVGTIERPLL